MRRLTYAPKAFVYVRSRNHQNKIFDLTDYVVEGTVDRLVNQKSTASIVLRNSFFQFSPERKDSFFLPMDGITIWLQRLKNKPIQVFTGYLDSVPYWQMFPGNCQITASCTLKRLEHIYFDPTINATTQFFNAMGWNTDGAGGYLNPDFNLHGDDSSGIAAETGAGISNDGGMGNVLKPFLINVCGWDASQIHIADLPPDLPAKAAKLYDTLVAENQAMVDGLEALMKGFMTLSADDSAASSQTSVQLGVVNKIYKAASDKNVDPVVMTLASMVMTGMDTSYVGPNGEVGLYAARNDKEPQSSGDAVNKLTRTMDSYNVVDGHTVTNEDFFSSPYNAQGASYDGKTAEQMMNPTTATHAFAHKLMLADKDKAFSKAAGKENLLAITEWIAKAAGVSQKSIAAKVINQHKTAKRLVAAYSGAKIGKNDPLLTSTAPSPLPAALKWSDHDAMFSNDSANDLTVFKKHYANANESLAPYAYVAHKSGLRLAEPPTALKRRPDILCFQDPTRGQEKASQIKQFFDWAKTQTGADIVRWENSSKKASNPTLMDAHKDTEYHHGVEILGAAQQDSWPEGYVYVQVQKVAAYPRWDGNPATGPNESNAVPPGSTTDQNTKGTKQLTFEDIASIGLQAAFYAQVNFPGNEALSNQLQGDKALMNDIPVMEGVKQMAGGSMRNFMSLPDGSFCAFYPDYFGGSDRKAYWAITDIEIINMGIQLNDTSLATHVYVTGATQNNPGVIDFNDAVNTLGVVTIQHVFGNGNFISGNIKGNSTRDVVSRGLQAYQFLKFYGARPLSVQQPLIKNQFFEFLYAWQLFMYMWASQFQTLCEFTFQPEMMAGGRVAFPDHGLEMYIESVHHQFSYEAGFTTSAVLMAPTTTVNDPKNPNFHPGMALAGTNLGGIGTV